MPTNNTEIERRLWDAADELRANSRLRAADYSAPVLGLIFLRFADHRFGAADAAIKAEVGQSAAGRRPRPISREDYHARGVLYLPEQSRFSHLVALPEGADTGAAIIDAMSAIEEHNPDLRDVLPKTYNRFDNAILRELLRIFSGVPMDIEGDVFGKIYEYFLGQFAMSEGQRGGEFFTPTSIVRLIVEIIEPFHGRILDPACGSGGMFVQSARFVERHQGKNTELSIFGQERVGETVRLCRMNLAVHGLAGDIREGNSYYDDIHQSLGKFDFVMANPPFNVNRVDKDRLKDDPRFPFGLPRVAYANYLWIQMFYSALGGTGRAGFVMANSAGDARGSELEVRKQLIESGAVDVIVSVGSNFFYTVTLPCTLWFLDRGRAQMTPSQSEAGEDIAARQRDTVLFLDARHVYTQIDRAHREFTPAQIEFLANVVRLYRGHEVELAEGSADLVEEHFPDITYQDAAGLCRVATLGEIEAQGWSLNPGRYVGVAEREEDDFDFAERLMELHEELEVLNAEAHELEERIAESTLVLLDSAQ